MKKLFAILFGLMLGLAALPAAAQTTAFTEGKDYVRIPKPVATATPAKIEVAYAFSFTCPHCFQMESAIQPWQKKQAADVAMVRLHVAYSPQMEPYQRGFYAAVTLKIQDKVLMPAFNAIYVEHKALVTGEQWADFFSAYGVSKQTALTTYNAFGVTSQIKQANSRLGAYTSPLYPELIIDGKYRINEKTAGSNENILKIADFLIAKVRAERAKKP